MRAHLAYSVLLPTLTQHFCYATKGSDLHADERGDEVITFTRLRNTRSRSLAILAKRVSLIAAFRIPQLERLDDIEITIIAHCSKSYVISLNPRRCKDDIDNFPFSPSLFCNGVRSFLFGCFSRTIILRLYLLISYAA